MFFVTFVPMRAAVLRVPDLSVVGAGPDQILSERRRRDREDHFAIKLAQIVADDPAGRNDYALGSCVERSGLITLQLWPPLVVLKITWQP